MLAVQSASGIKLIVPFLLGVQCFGFWGSMEESQILEFLISSFNSTLKATLKSCFRINRIVRACKRKKQKFAVFVFISTATLTDPHKSPRGYVFSTTSATRTVSEVDRKYCFIHTINGQKAILLFAGETRGGFGHFKTSLLVSGAPQQAATTSQAAPTASCGASITKIPINEFLAVGYAIMQAINECHNDSNPLEVLAIVRSTRQTATRDDPTVVLELIRYYYDEAKKQAVFEKKKAGTLVHVGHGEQEAQAAFSRVHLPLGLNISPSYHVRKDGADDLLTRGYQAMRKIAEKEKDVGGACTMSTLTIEGEWSHRVVPLFNSQKELDAKRNSYSKTVVIQNAIVLQSYELNHLQSPVEIEATGSSIAFVQVQYSYHRNRLRDDAPFFCSKEVHDTRGGNRLQLDLCCNYTKAGSHSNMATMEVEALSGYKFDSDEMDKLTKISDLQRVELDHDDTKMNIYFNPLGDAPVCLSLYSDMVYQVADQKPAQFALYDYYDPEQQVKSTYSIHRARAFDENCPECWSDSALAAPSGPRNGKSASSTPASHGSLSPSGNPESLFSFIKRERVMVSMDRLNLLLKHPLEEFNEVVKSVMQ